MNKVVKSAGVTISKMRAILVKEFGAANVLKVEENVEIPPMEDNEVCINVHYSGINPVDTYIRSGAYAKLPELPYVPGKDAAGTVAKVGSAVSRFKVGDRVFCSATTRFGTLAQFTSIKENNVFPLGGLSFQEGACLGTPYFTAYRALIQKANAVKSNRVLIHGASGAVGLAAVQIAKHFGMTVVGTAGTAAGLELVKSVGADEVFNHRDASYLEALVSNGGFDVILEMLANVNLQHDLKMLNSRGKVVIIGCRGDINISPRLLMGLESSIIGCGLANTNQEEYIEQTEGILNGIEKGWVKPVIHKTYNLNEVQDAHHDIINSKGAQGNLVVKI